MHVRPFDLGHFSLIILLSPLEFGNDGFNLLTQTNWE